MTEENVAMSKSLKWPIPYNISLDTLHTIVRGFFQSKADTQPVTIESICSITGLFKTTVGANVKFLQALEVLKAEEGTDGYKFEAKGAEYAKALSTGETAKEAAVLKEIIANSPLKQLADFVKLRKSVGKLDYDSLFMQIKAMGRVRDNPKFPRGVSNPYATGINTLIDLLKRADIVPQDIVADKTDVTPKISKPPKPKRQRVRKEEPTQSSPPSTTTIESNLSGEENIPFTINITVEAKDPESIKELINLLRELKQLSKSN